MVSFPMPFSLIFKYFLFLSVLTAPVNYIMLKPRINQIIAEHPEWEDELNQFIKIEFAVMFGTPLLVGIIQLMGGFNHPFFILTRDFTNPFIVLAWLVLFVSIVWHSVWVVFLGGAKQMAKFHGLFNLPKNETMLKLTFAGSALAGLAGFIVALYFNVGAQIPF